MPEALFSATSFFLKFSKSFKNLSLTDRAVTLKSCSGIEFKCSAICFQARPLSSEPGLWLYGSTTKSSVTRHSSWTFFQINTSFGIFKGTIFHFLGVYEFKKTSFSSRRSFRKTLLCTNCLRSRW